MKKRIRKIIEKIPIFAVDGMDLINEEELAKEIEKRKK